MSCNNHRRLQDSRQLGVVFSFNFVLVIVTLLKSGLISNLTMRLELLPSAFVYICYTVYVSSVCIFMYLLELLRKKYRNYLTHPKHELNLHVGPLNEIKHAAPYQISHL